jgi:N-acetylglucosamine kinase-like BadF-type ATPase
MNYLIGINAGGTKTECAIADLSGKILINVTGKSSNYLIAGANNTAANLLSLISKCLKKVNGNFSDVKQIVVGIAGAGRSKDAKELESSLNRFANSKKLKFSFVKVVSDALIALEAAFPDSTGCILIAGTGSIIFGKDKAGNLYRTGGFGRIIGDEGSGYSIGRKALQAVSKYLDGRAESSFLTKLVLKQMKINSSEELITKVYKENFEIASVAPIVISAAEKKDKTATGILDEHADELILHIKSMRGKMKVKKLNVAFSGGLIANKNFYSKLLAKKINSSLKSVKIIKPKLHPVEGAILIAKKILNS